VDKLTSSAVDWAAVLAELGGRIPAGLAVTNFTGASGTAAASSTAAAASSSTSAPHPTVPGAIGSFNATVGGTFPNDAHFSPVALWIDGVSASKMFSPPGVAAVANTPAGPNTSVTFQSSVAIMSAANMAKNGGQ
jgi:hypothetical protein